MTNVFEKNQNIEAASKKSVKWSLLTEFFVKIATPLSTAVLARILAPEIFGITAAVTIVVSFCEAITDTGLAKFIVQHDFKDESEYKKYIFASLCFSLILSAVLFVLIFIFRYQISSFIGNSGYETILVVSCAQLPFYAINSIFTAHLKRIFKFNKIFLFRMIFCLTPFLVTIPLSLLKLGPWALVIGSIAAQALQTPFLIIFCKKIVSLQFSIKTIGNTIKFSYLMIIESIIVWMSTWLLTFFSAQFFNPYIVGIVKVSNSTVTNIFALFSTSFNSVLFSTLSRLKDNDDEFQKNFYSIQSCAFALIVPLSIGSFFYADVIVKIFLGNQWLDAIEVVSILCLSMLLHICVNNFVSEAFRSKGDFVLSIIYHVMSLGVNISLKLWLGKDSLTMFAWTNVFTYIIMAVVALLILKFRYNYSLTRQIRTLFPTLICCLFMAPFFFMKSFGSYNFTQSIFQVVLCATAYMTSGFLLYRSLFINTFSYLGLEKAVKTLMRI